MLRLIPGVLGRRCAVCGVDARVSHGNSGAGRPGESCGDGEVRPRSGKAITASGLHRRAVGRDRLRRRRSASRCEA